MFDIIDARCNYEDDPQMFTIVDKPTNANEGYTEIFVLRFSLPELNIPVEQSLWIEYPKSWKLTRTETKY